MAARKKKKTDRKKPAAKRKAPAKKKAAKKKVAKKKVVKKKVVVKKKAPVVKKTASISLGRRERFTPAEKPPLKLPVAVSTKAPIRPESLRPSTWIQRTVPGH